MTEKAKRLSFKKDLFFVKKSMNDRIWIKIFPSLLSIHNLSNNEIWEIMTVLKDTVDWWHVDVMDGKFVDNKTRFSPNFLKSIKKYSKAPFDVHLMVKAPNKDLLQKYYDAWADIITIHPEAYDTIEQVEEHLKIIKNLGCKAGLAYKPKTTITWIGSFIKNTWLDLVLIMTVEPWAWWQSYMEEMHNKIHAVRKKLDHNNRGNILLEVDGGINTKTIQKALASWADTFVSGNAIFKDKTTKEMIQTIESMRW